MSQTNLDLTDKQPTALMRLEAILYKKIVKGTNMANRNWNAAIYEALGCIELMKPSELADLMQSFCDGYVQTESAETWSKKWGVNGG